MYYSVIENSNIFFLILKTNFLMVTSIEIQILIIKNIDSLYEGISKLIY